MPWWVRIIVAVGGLYAIWIFRQHKRIREDPKFYYERSGERGQKVLSIISAVENELNKPHPSENVLRSNLDRLREITYAQRDDIVPPELEPHRRNYYQFFDIQYRMLDDIVNNDGQNIAAIACERQRLIDRTKTEFDQSRREMQQMREFGIPVPDFSNRYR